MPENDIKYLPPLVWICLTPSNIYIVPQEQIGLSWMITSYKEHPILTFHLASIEYLLLNACWSKYMIMSKTLSVQHDSSLCKHLPRVAKYLPRSSKIFAMLMLLCVLLDH